MEDINKNTAGDYAYALGKGVLGMVPVAGSLASEILSMLVASPLEKRRQKWMQEVGKQLLELQSKSELNIESLSANDLFIDVVAQASTLAIKTSESEKIKAFQNAIINTALGIEPDKTISSIFLNLIDSFTSWHIAILHFFDDPAEWYSRQNRPLPQAGGLWFILVDAYPALQSQRALADLVWADLNRAGLLNTSSLGGMMTTEGARASRTTELGKRFLQFITEQDIAAFPS